MAVGTIYIETKNNSYVLKLQLLHTVPIYTYILDINVKHYIG